MYTFIAPNSIYYLQHTLHYLTTSYTTPLPHSITTHHTFLRGTFLHPYSTSPHAQIKTFLYKNESFYNIAIYSDEGLAVFEEGKITVETSDTKIIIS